MRRPAALATSIALLVLAAACDDAGPRSITADTVRDTDVTGPDDTGPEDTLDDGDPTSAIEWEDFGGDGSVQTGSLEVPIDYDDPSKGTFDLFLARHLADPDERIGTLLVNPGGPGFGGSDYGIYADQVYGEELLAHFDILGWDPRGTGLSEPAVDCTGDYDHFYAGTDITPDDDAERQQIIDLAEEFAAACEASNADILPYIGTNNSARDMNAIREALGEETISYFGFSYGSELGATWATLFPDTVRAAVLDGAADPNAGFIESGLQQAEGFEGTFDTFLAQCSANPDCDFYNDGDAEGAFDELMQSLDDKPIPTVDGRPDLTRGMALTGVAQSMYSQVYWPQLEKALAAAQKGKGERMLELFDEYFQRRSDGTYDNSLEAFQAIVCMDDAERLSVEEEDATADQFQAVAPRMSPGTTGSYFCTFFPEAADPRVQVTGAGAGPILVMGTTGDPATPLSSTEAMADALEDGRLVIVTADQHTGYGVNQCSRQVIDDYLVDPVANAPQDGTRCD